MKEKRTSAKKPLPALHSAQNIMIAKWLGICAIMVFLMAIIGAVTRLTGSGLSMVVWEPIMGFIPPMSDTEWMRVFEMYRESPEYRHKNMGMSLSEFQYIFFWEWFHRVWGRLIGIVFFLPYLYFLIRRQIPQGWNLKLLGLLLLGSAQGFMGWFMVQSGLVDQPHVSHYRLAAHLSLAAIIFMVLIWFIAQLTSQRDLRASESAKHWGRGALIAIFITLIWGAFVAGMKAGLIHNTFPLMAGQIMPPEMWHLSPWWLNLFENPAAVQWVHRLLAVITTLVVVGFWWRVWQLSNSFHGLLVLVFLQVIVGITTLLTQLDIFWATLHQAGAFLLLGKALYVYYRLDLKKGSK